jgi:transposase
MDGRFREAGHAHQDDGCGQGRARIEQAVGKLKRFKRIALRCEKSAQNYGSFVALACAFILIKSVHTA